MVCYFDMLFEVFKDMWEYFKVGKFWMGMVKNCCKNGDYYWVDVFVLLIKENGKVVEYQLVCLCLSWQYVDNVDKFYKEIKVGKIFWQLKMLCICLWQCLGFGFIVVVGVSFVVD